MPAANASEVRDYIWQRTAENRMRLVTPHHLQQKLSKICMKKDAEGVRARLCDMEKASLLSFSQPNASLWLTTLPTEHHYTLESWEMRMLLRMRLHMPPAELGHQRSQHCSCDSRENALGQDALHFLSCPTLLPVATKRHDLVVRALASVARDMDLGVEVEQRDFSQPDQRRLRPDLRFTLPTARPVFMRSDVAVTHPATRAVVEAQPSTADTPLLAAMQTEKKKIRKYSALVQH